MVEKETDVYHISPNNIFKEKNTLVEKHLSYSSLFADDLAALFFFKKTGKVKSKIKNS